MPYNIDPQLLMLLAPIAMLLGMQIQISELRLLSGRYRYSVQAPQLVTFGAAMLALVLASLNIAYVGYICHRLIASGLETMTCVWIHVANSLVPLCAFVAGEWMLSKLNPRTATRSWAFRLLLCLLLTLTIVPHVLNFVAFLPVGLYLRNNPFGIPHGKNLCIAYHMQRRRKHDYDAMNFITPEEEALLPETTYAGCKRCQNVQSLQRHDVTTYGIRPGSHTDYSEQLQALIDKVGQAGGGIIYFPRGRYHFNSRGDGFLQINHSRIVLEGETDADGRPLATLVSCEKTSRGHKNPWISPFFITTGEALQPSNEFWGLQFRKRQATVLRSNSLSDPGSDGSILSPDVTARIIAPAAKGSSSLQVDDASKVGQYILVGLYNTTPDGALIRDILGVDTLRPEWTVANRAGAEEAPSYQWLVEVKRKVGDHTIELVRPLLRDVELCHDPVVCNVEMLEHIVIRNLCLDSQWNGQFRHHGFPLYYNIARTQEMDYGWNAINMKRCAHSEVNNVVISNFSNPLYVLDSRNVSVSRIEIKGYDGHQGLKVYMHTCDCLFEDVTFRAHFADMMGGEGNAYANLFRRISYLNPTFKPVEYDFHGFASEPMSPPSDNMFTRIQGFRYFKSAGSLSHLPSLARRNVWWNIETEGEGHGDYLFYAMTYREKKGLMRIVYATGYAVAMVQKTRNLSPRAFVSNLTQKLSSIDEVGYPRSLHKALFFPDNHVYGISTTGRVE